MSHLTIVSEVVVVQDDGTEVPYEPELLAA